MKIYILHLAFMILLFTSCKKDKPNPIPPKLQYAIFSDLTNDKKLAGLQIYLFTIRQLGGLNGGLINVIIDSQTTNSEGRIEYRNDLVEGVECTAPGFFAFHYSVVGLMDYDGLTYNVKLLPKAFLNIHLAPSSIYPTTYRFSMGWSCRDSLQPVNTFGLIDFPDPIIPVDSSFVATIGGDVYNDISWKLEDENQKVVASDTIRNIIIPRSDTTNIQIAF